MEQYCFLNGKILPINGTKIGLRDVGILRGYGVYDGLTAFNGKPFRFADHWNRLLSGAHILNLNVPITEETAEKKIIELISKNGVSARAIVRIILTGGETFNGIEYDFDSPTFYILVENWDLPFGDKTESVMSDGGKLVSYRHMREMPEYKTTNYISAVNLQNWRKEEGAVEILYVYDGEVLECSTSNIFLVKNGKILTPSDNILKGITRKVVLELASQKYPVEERPIREEELKMADEVFITSSFKDIVPVSKIDDFDVNGGGVGPVTKDLMKAFAEVIKV